MRTWSKTLAEYGVNLFVAGKTESPVHPYYIRIVNHYSSPRVEVGSPLRFGESAFRCGAPFRSQDVTSYREAELICRVCVVKKPRSQDIGITT